LNTSPAGLRRHIDKPPFVKRQAMVGTGPIVINGSTQVAGPKKLCLVRIGEAPPKDVADEAKRVMIKIWNSKMKKPVTRREGSCLWGLAKDMIALSPELGLPADLGGELAIAVFKYALNNWQSMASAIKIAMEARKGYKSRFYDYPCIPVILSFYKTALHA
jgi:hypothetical protein